MTTLTQFIADVRTSLEDYGDTITDGNMTGDGTSKVFKLSSFPILTTSESVTVAGVAQTSPTNYTLNYDNGELTFVTAPTNAAAVVATYTKVTWRDERITTAINAGIRELYPALYKIGELYLLAQNNKWDYDLSSATDVPTTFADYTLPTVYVPATARTDIVKAQTKIHYAQLHPYGSNQQFVPFDYYHRTTPGGLRVDLDLTPNSIIRMVYTAPFTVLVNGGDVTDVPDEFYMLPIWYALSVLMEKKEARRARFDQYVVTQNSNATPVGTQSQTAEDYLRRYYDTLKTNAMRPFRMETRRTLRSWQMYQRY